jgi:predicted enzyme related to lactoylglutathione lyase
MKPRNPEELIMSNDSSPEVGSIVWHDLTVKNATEVRDFYAAVVGWTPEPVSMGDYDDFNMNNPGSGATSGGVCHAQGGNEGLPAQWLMYVKVADAKSSAEQCVALGGKVLKGPVTFGGDAYYTIEDPSGAAMVIFSAV